MELTILLCFAAYTLLLFLVMWLTNRRGTKGNEAFFRAGRKSPWPVVAYGMIGASLSGVTFMSVPGDVLANKWFYFPMVLGYVLGYATIALVLLPLYYRLNLTSIYSYLEQRFGLRSERTGALFFIISRLLGSALRMYLVVYVLYEFVFSAWGIPFGSPRWSSSPSSSSTLLPVASRPLYGPIPCRPPSSSLLLWQRWWWSSRTSI